jgi:hypothetical protein
MSRCDGVCDQRNDPVDREVQNPPGDSPQGILLSDRCGVEEEESEQIDRLGWAQLSSLQSVEISRRQKRDDFVRMR